MPKNQSFQTPSAKPVDVEYRLKRLRATLADAMMFLTAIDPSVDPERHELLTTDLTAAMAAAEKFSAPAKKARKSADEKAAAAAAKEQARLDKAAAKALAKAEAKAATAKAAREEKTTKALKAEAADLEVEEHDDGTLTAAPPAAKKPGSAIERALAAAKARKAAKKEVA